MRTKMLQKNNLFCAFGGWGMTSVPTTKATTALSRTIHNQMVAFTVIYYLYA